MRHAEGPARLREPAKGDVKLAVSRKKATGPGKRLGSLLVNPGGPGGSAVGYLQAYAGIGYPAEVRARYDMVAVDPRGVARSEPVECLTGREMDTYTQTDTTPDNARETGELVDAFKEFAEGCGRRCGGTCCAMCPRSRRPVTWTSCARRWATRS